MASTHLVDVAPERLAGWVERFTDSHGPLTWSVATDDTGEAWEARAQDGSWARLRSWRAPRADESAGPAPGWERPPPLLVVLVRRGGYAVALVGPDGSLEQHKVGTRHVQSRTAAGGWSQQRFARRRGNQADVLVEAVAGHTARVLGEELADRGAVPEGLVLGGDRGLADAVLRGLPTATAGVRGLPRRTLWDVPDPRRSVLDDAVRRGRAVRVQVHNA
ncbi:acVLRF1 family peptidyl-tRNA hydrolase [uncultured Serinicoccus sp.]|uniref:acVLRF1 family peptidyl-tRNA hydrolase n=1 Tax=uncultured Serinicoccus sp. TaxID=735514 RepID=UPI002622BD92|nr:acVLRF1 family peptidyl-tRNA hydrolase [uncultured Serinicoccus sp.]